MDPRSRTRSFTFVSATGAGPSSYCGRVANARLGVAEMFDNGNRIAFLCAVCDRAAIDGMVPAIVSAAFARSSICVLEHRFAAGAAFVSARVGTGFQSRNAGAFMGRWHCNLCDGLRDCGLQKSKV